MNTLSQKLGKLEEGTLQPACCEAQTDHTAKLECHGQPAPQAIDFALCFGKVVRSLVLWTEPRSRVLFQQLIFGACNVQSTCECSTEGQLLNTTRDASQALYGRYRHT